MKKQTPSSLRPRFLLVVGVFSLALSGVVQAQEINWGGAINDVNVDSNNVALDAATYTFQMGVFTNNDDPLTEFIPNASNTDFWASSWVALDSVLDYNEGSSYFASSYDLVNNTYENFQGYIWVYNNQVGDETSEWVLITDNTTAAAWKIPTFPGTQQDLPLQWRVSTATTPIFGGLNNTDGPGERSEDPGTYDIQTQTFLPVPEPGVTLLAAFASAALLLGRRRI